MPTDPYSSILLVGDRGMLAHAIKRSLARRDLTAVGVDRDECDITDAASVAATFAEHRPTLVFNCAAYTAVDKAEQEEGLARQINADGPANLAVACRDAGATLVHYSTDFVFDGTATEPYKTDAPASPAGAYGRTKLAGERAIAASRLDDHLVLRTAWLYGPGPGRPFPKVMLDAARAGKPLKVIADQHGGPTFTLDLADVTLALLDSGERGLFHATGAGRTTWFGFTQAIMETFGVTPQSLAPIAAADWAKIKPDAAPRPAFSVLDLTKTEQAIGRSLRPWRESIADYRDLTGGQG